METFEKCVEANSKLEEGRLDQARELLIRLINDPPEDIELYPELVNELLTACGLMAYTNGSRATWWQRFQRNAFTFDIGGGERKVLHQPQAEILGELLLNKSVALSAPTSFGKSFIIDAYIEIKRPKTVLIIVPTIALMDEFRRRLTKKFSHIYRIVTTVKEIEDGRCIYILPQERAIKLIHKIDQLDFFVVDEFYKVSQEFDKDRSDILARAVLYFRSVSRQSYFLTPNISDIVASPLTEGMKFVDKLNFSTVFLDVHDLSNRLKNRPELKAAWLVQMLSEADGKTLIYAGTFTAIDSISSHLIRELPIKRDVLLNDFAAWLEENYTPDWNLPSLVRRGVGIHNGKIHRSLAALQVQLFEEPGEGGLSTIVSTSSIIEGVNTSAKNIVVWLAKNGSKNLRSLPYKNLIGRGGRMFKHFVGHIYVLEKAPKDTPTQLNFELSANVLGRSLLDSNVDVVVERNPSVVKFMSPLLRELTPRVASLIIRDERLSTDNMEMLARIAREIKSSSILRRKLSNLNSPDPRHWGAGLYEILNITKISCGAKHTLVVDTIKVLSENWSKGSKHVVRNYLKLDSDVELLFKIEREASFKLASAVSDISVVCEHIGASDVNIERFGVLLANCFMPRAVCQPEEFGLPRIVTRKLRKAKVLSDEDLAVDADRAVEVVKSYGLQNLERLDSLEKIELYMLDRFLDGVTAYSKAEG